MILLHEHFTHDMPFSCTYHILEMDSGHVLAAIVITFTVKMSIAIIEQNLVRRKLKNLDKK